MEFINDQSLKHPFFKDIIRINYNQTMPPNLTNDYGYSYIMIRYGKFETWNYNEEAVSIPKIFVKGTGDYFKVTAYENSSWLSFEMPNHYLYNITKINATENRNKLIDLSSYVSSDILDKLYDALREVHQPKEMVDIVDAHLKDFYDEWSKELPSTQIVDYIFEKDGKVSLSEILDKFSYSQRSLGRLFYKEVGATPYRFICLVRFNYIIRELQKENPLPVKELIYEYNYFDHSHFEKDFQKFLGQSVRDYKNDYNPLLTNGLARHYKDLR